MRHFFKAVLPFVICALIIPGFVNGLTNAQEVFIKFKKDANPSEIESFTKEFGLTKVKSNPEIGVNVFRIPNDQNVAEVIRLCSNKAFIEYIEPTQTVRALAEEKAEAVAEPEAAISNARLRTRIAHGVCGLLRSSEKSSSAFLVASLALVN